MSRVAVMISILALTLVGSAALGAACPEACPPPCPVPSPCPQVVPPCEVAPTCAPVAPTCAPCAPTCVPPAPVVSMPADVGAGPQFGDLCGADFDKAYMQAMYQQHSDIAAVATQGIGLTTDQTLKNLSGKIRYEQTKMNEKLGLWYPQLCGGGNLTVDYSRTQCVLSQLTTMCGPSFDCSYAQTMIKLLQQSKDASDIAMERATFPGLRDQARIASRSAFNEINALSRWGDVNRCGAGPCEQPAPCPAPCPALPSCPPPACPPPAPACPPPAPACP